MILDPVKSLSRRTGPEPRYIEINHEGKEKKWKYILRFCLLIYGIYVSVLSLLNKVGNAAGTR